MEFNILYAIQAIHSSFLDNIILAITKVMGNYGQIWLLVSLALLIPKKTRKAGVCIISSYISCDCSCPRFLDASCRS